MKILSAVEVKTYCPGVIYIEGTAKNRRGEIEDVCWVEVNGRISHGPFEIMMKEECIEYAERSPRVRIVVASIKS